MVEVVILVTVLMVGVADRMVLMARVLAVAKALLRKWLVQVVVMAVIVDWWEAQVVEVMATVVEEVEEVEVILVVVVDDMQVVEVAQVTWMRVELQ